MLVDVPCLADSDYVNLPAALRHIQIMAVCACVFR